jgi:hypothetical protein
MLEEEPGLQENAAASTLLTRAMDKTKKVVVDGETLHLVEGDLLLDDDELAIWALQQETLDAARKLGLAAIAPVSTASSLVGITTGIGGKIVRWKDGLQLSYCVLKGTFTVPGQYETIRDNMLKATVDWEKVCGIKFNYRSDLDNSPGTANPGAVFTVRSINAGGQFIASAFFPNDPIIRRRVLIDPSYFSGGSGGFDKVGVLRHELGHTLGFRHEHIRSGAPPGCPDEDLFGTINLGAYDPHSVMHYFCGGVGSLALAITELDREAAQKVYGLPLSDYDFVE